MTVDEALAAGESLWHTHPELRGTWLAALEMRHDRFNTLDFWRAQRVRKLGAYTDGRPPVADCPQADQGTAEVAR